MSTVPFAVEGNGSGTTQHITVRGQNTYEFHADTDVDFGGENAAPSPMSYVLASLTSCNQVTAQLVAQDLGVRLGHFRFRARGDLDPAVFARGEEGFAGFQSVRVEATVETDAEGQDFDHFVDEVERRCPLTQLFPRGGFIYESSWQPLPLAD